MYTILGAGLAGLSCSFHLGHDVCEIFEQNAYVGGHIHGEKRDGFTWDEGPHVSFTKHDYVKNLFAESTEYLEYPVFPTNYYRGNWIPHPAQTNLYAAPEEVRQQCVDDFLLMRKTTKYSSVNVINYKEWLEFAYGKSFTQTFPSAYTTKYWTTSPENLTTDWVGSRMYFPAVEDVVNGAVKPLNKSTHYITSVRYPKNGGFFSFAKKMAVSANVHYGKKLSFISFSEKLICFSDGTQSKYEKLISTIPLSVLIQQSEAPADIKAAAAALSCSSILMVNVVANHHTQRSENWIYVYDEDKYSTRINFTELLSPANGVPGSTGIQVEVYYSKYNTLNESPEDVASAVCKELIEMGLIVSESAITSVHTKWIEWANVVFDHKRRVALNSILDWLTQFGLEREFDDLEPSSDWDMKFKQGLIFSSNTSLFLAGRFGQWNYSWTDDCVLRGKYLSEKVVT